MSKRVVIVPGGLRSPVVAFNSLDRDGFRELFGTHTELDWVEDSQAEIDIWFPDQESVAHLTYNMAVNGGMPVVGPAVICRSDCKSLTAEQARTWVQKARTWGFVMALTRGVA